MWRAWNSIGLDRFHHGFEVDFFFCIFCSLKSRRRATEVPGLTECRCGNASIPSSPPVPSRTRVPPKEPEDQTICRTGGAGSSRGCRPYMIQNHCSPAVGCRRRNDPELNPHWQVWALNPNTIMLRPTSSSEDRNEME